MEVSGAEAAYERGEQLLSQGKREEAATAFLQTYRASEDPILKKKALEQLEGLDVVKGL